MSVIVAIFAIAAIMTNCDKDGQNGKNTDGIYRPERRISAIYTSNSHYPTKTLYQKWVWGEKDLEKITWHDEEGMFATTTFSYLNNKGQLSEIKEPVFVDGVENVKYRYKNSKISGIDFYVVGMVEYSLDVLETKNGKITKVAVYEDGDKEGEGTYIYSKNNLVTRTSNDSRNTETVTYQYDNKNNPFHNFFRMIPPFIMETDLDALLYSKNNCIVDAYGNTIEYKYDGDWPIEKRLNYRDGSYYIEYYEYEN